MTNLELVKTYQDAIWNLKDTLAIDKYVDEHVLIHSPVETSIGTERMKAIITQWHNAFPNLEVIWDDFICEGDKVVCRWHAFGRHESEFQGVSPTNNTISYNGITIYQIANSKVEQYWALVDMHRILQQLKS